MGHLQHFSQSLVLTAKLGLKSISQWEYEKWGLVSFNTVDQTINLYQANLMNTGCHHSAQFNNGKPGYFQVVRVLKGNKPIIEKVHYLNVQVTICPQECFGFVG